MNYWYSQGRGWNSQAWCWGKEGRCKCTHNLVLFWWSFKIKTKAISNSKIIPSGCVLMWRRSLKHHMPFIVLQFNFSVFLPSITSFNISYLCIVLGFAASLMTHLLSIEKLFAYIHNKMCYSRVWGLTVNMILTDITCGLESSYIKLMSKYPSQTYYHICQTHLQRGKTSS